MTPGRRITLAIILAAAVVYLVGNDRVGLWDRDEPRYAQTSKQMLQSEPPNWVVPRLLDDVRTAKPVFIYWCQAGAMRIFGPTPFAARLPSTIAMVLTLLILSHALARHLGWEMALWTTFIFATAGLTIAAAKMAITDGVLLLFIVVAQLCLFAVYNGDRRWSITLIHWLAVALAVLTKGPVVLGVQLTTMIVLACFEAGRNWRSGAEWKRALAWWGRNWRSAAAAWRAAFAWWGRTRPLVGLVLVAAVVGPWLLAIERHHPGFLTTTLWHDVFQRTIRPLEGHRGPPGFYLATIWVTWFPWSLLLPTALTIGWANRASTPHRFALAAIIGPWLMFEIVQTKLVHYLLPAFPALAFLTADALLRCIRGRNDDLHRPIFTAAAAVWSISAIAAVGLLYLPLRHYSELPKIHYISIGLLTACAVAYTGVVFYLWRSRRLAPAAWAMGGGMLGIIVLLCALYLPSATFLWLPERLGSWLAEHGATEPGQVVMIDYKEDSVPFYQGGTIRKRDDDYFAADPSRWAEWVVITREAWGKAPEAHRHYEEQASFRGLAYANRGRRVEVVVMRKNVISRSD